MSGNIRINVIGAGVIGLTTGLILQRIGYKVKIIAEDFPDDVDIDYTSPNAGADWRFNVEFSDKSNIIYVYREFYPFLRIIQFTF